jgi:hypothetical protein
MIALGHIAGIPVEETLLGMLPVGAVGVGAVVYAVRSRTSRLRRFTARGADAIRRLRRG